MDQRPWLFEGSVGSVGAYRGVYRDLGTPGFWALLEFGRVGLPGGWGNPVDSVFKLHSDSSCLGGVTGHSEVRLGFSVLMDKLVFGLIKEMRGTKANRSLQRDGVLAGHYGCIGPGDRGSVLDDEHR